MVVDEVGDFFQFRQVVVVVKYIIGLVGFQFDGYFFCQYGFINVQVMVVWGCGGVYGQGLVDCSGVVV